MTYRPLDSGIFTCTMTALTSGTITLNTGINKVSWWRSPKDKSGLSYVRVMGHLEVNAISAPVGELRVVCLPFNSANPTGTPPAWDADAVVDIFPVFIQGFGGTIGSAKKIIEGYNSATASHETLIRLFDLADSTIADSVVVASKVELNFGYWTDDP